ncbi:MAG: DHA2 family efflux MFS transporter permease subunit [Terracidiphilus sp.]|nr:DHA2 family efflux MFS transporter permease subunit [Terracidiphilus sp.]
MTTVSPSQSWKPKHNPWLICVVVALAAFMEVLDTSICNVALPHIAGSMGFSMSEGTWVLTTYLVANAIVLPITGWISSVIGRKRFFLFCIVVFTLCSLLCGVAPNIETLLLARALQGASGGGMQPMAQAIMADSVPPKQRGMAFALFGVTAVVAPALGPTLGGWITDNYTWRWIFFINIPVGLLAFALIFQLVEDPPFLRRFKPGQVRLDTLGLSLLVLGIGALQILLDKGQEDDWLASHFIVTLVVIAAVCLSTLVWWEWKHKAPVVDVHLFRNINFASSSIVMFLAGTTSFSAGILMPQFLQAMAGYTAVSAGMVVSAGATIVLFTLPIAGVLTTKVPIKYTMAFGWALSATGLYISAHIHSLQLSFGYACLMMVMQFAPIAFIFISATTSSYFGVPANRSDSVAGLANFMRNIGSSVGTSVIQTILARRTQFHLSRLGEHAVASDPSFQFNLAAGAYAMGGHGLPPGSLLSAALGRAYMSFQMQAMTLSYVDAYMFMAVCSAAMVFLSLLIKKNDPHHTEMSMGH